MEEHKPVFLLYLKTPICLGFLVSLHHLGFIYTTKIILNKYYLIFCIQIIKTASQIY